MGSYSSSLRGPRAMASLHHLQFTDARHATVNNVTGDQHNVHVSNPTINREYYYLRLLFLTKHLHVISSSDINIRRLTLC
jgi:hypothetical protein